MRAIGLSSLVLAATVLGSVTAYAQSAGVDEMIQPSGVVTQDVTLTAAQKNAIYKAVFQQPGKTYTFELSASVGSDVPPSVELIDLPGDVIGTEPWAAGLKYAMAGDDMVVVVDPVRRRVIDVIHGGFQP